MSSTTRLRAVALLLAGSLAVAGCTADDDVPSPGTTTAVGAEASLTPGQEVDVADFFERTQQAILEAKTYTMAMTMETDGEVITMNGTGDVTDPNTPRADMTLSLPGSQGEMHMIMDGQDIYLQMPGVGDQGQYVEMPLSVLSQAGGQDLTTLVNPAENLRLTQEAVERVVYVGREDQGGHPLDRYTVHLNPQRLATQVETPAPTPSIPSEMPYDVWVDESDLMRRMTMTADGTTMTMTTDDFGRPVQITAPPSASRTQLPGLSNPTGAPAAPTAATTDAATPIPTPAGATPTGATPTGATPTR